MTPEEQKRQEDLQRLRSLRPMDDDFMRCLFKDNSPLAALVLRIITGKPGLIITDCQTQKDMKRLAGARSICLDAYGTDTLGKKYDMEIQRADKGAFRRISYGKKDEQQKISVGPFAGRSIFCDIDRGFPDCGQRKHSNGKFLFYHAGALRRRRNAWRDAQLTVLNMALFHEFQQ